MRHWLWDQVACLVVRFGYPAGSWYTLWGPFWLYHGENSAHLGVRVGRRDVRLCSF